MRIAYVCYGDAFTLDGVTKKIGGQVRRWREAGHDVDLVFVSFAPATAGSRPAVDARIFPFRGMRGRVSATVAAARAVRRLRPDLVYLRYDWFTPPLPPVLWPTPVVVEVNSDDRRETALYGRRISLYNEVHRLATLPLAAGFVCVTHELTRTLGWLGGRRPTAVIANGIETSALPDGGPAVAGRANGSGDRAVMLIGATPVPSWNGVDRVIGLAEAMPEVEFDLVGPVRPADLGRRPTNVHLHGMLPLAGYAPLLAQASIALGPLALYRKGMSEACPLKVREYLLHGLPVLTSHEDTDFIGQDPWFLRRLTNAEGDVRAEVPAIRGWLDEIDGRRVPPEAVLPRLGTDAKERERLAFFRHVLERSGRRRARR